MSELTVPDKALLVGGLMITQTIGWGTTYSQVGILATPISEDLGLARGTIFLGATMLYLCAAIAAPVSGRLADRLGGLRLLIPGSVVIAAGLWLLSMATGPHGYLAPWALMGTVFHVGLVTATYTALSQTLGARAVTWIGTLTLATGLCSSIFWPVSELLLQGTDWRGVFRIYAAVTLGLCLPIHILLALRFGGLRAGAGQEGPPAAPAHILPDKARPGQVLMILAASLGSFLGVGFGLAVIELFRALGAGRAEAVAAGSLIGVAFVISRALATVYSERLSPARLARITYVALPLSFVPLLPFAVTGAPLPGWVAVLVGLAFGLPAALVGILRSTFPLYLFGSEGYGARLGKQGRATELASAMSPFVFTWAMGISLTGLIGGLVGLGLIALMATLRLTTMVQTEPEGAERPLNL